MSERIGMKKEDKETLDRLTAPAHVVKTHFSRHERVEGFHEYKDVPDFVSSDRLLKLDTLYGTVQLGYNPRKGLSFVYANIKTSIYDSAHSRFQKELKEYQMFRSRKADTQNIMYTSKKREDSAVLVYKAANSPWGNYSIRPYLQRLNTRTLSKTMPFLELSSEKTRRSDLAQEYKTLSHRLRGEMQKGDYSDMAEIRRRQNEISTERETVQSIIIRKDTQNRLFFRKINEAFDYQKHDMFAYYRRQRLERRGEAPVSDMPEENKGENEDE